jgi:hypothetical protein
MDTLDKYRNIIERILTEVARITPSTDDVVYKTIFDRKTDSYGLIAVGWEKKRRVHHFVIHLEIINGKVWIQEDNTDLVIADDLERAGIPKSDIVLGFQPPSVRPYTEYAAA